MNCDPQNWGSHWFNQLLQKREFLDCVTEIYEQDFLPLLTELTEVEIKKYADVIYSAALMNQERWNLNEVTQEIKELEQYLDARTDFLNGVWLEGKTYVTVVSNYRGRMTTYAVSNGDHMPQLPPPPESYGWYYEGTDIPVDLTQSVHENTRIIVKRLETESSGW